MSDWYKKGDEGKRQSKMEDEIAKKRREGSNVWRFWQPNDSSKNVIFLDNPDFFFHEHSLWNLTKKMDFATCIKDSDDGPCSMCDYGNPSYSLAATIIDLSSNESKDKKTGETKIYKNQKRLFVAKGKARQNLLRRMAENGGDLTGALFVLSRGTETNEAGTGEDFVFKGFVSKEKLAKICPDGADFKEWSTPYNYAKILAPMSAAQMRQLTGAPAPVGGDDDISDLVDDTPGGDSADDLIGDDSGDDSGGDVIPDSVEDLIG